MYWSLVILAGVTALYAGYNLLVKVSSGHVPDAATTPILATISLQAAALAVSLAFAAGLVLQGGHVLGVSRTAVVMGGGGRALHRRGGDRLLLPLSGGGWRPADGGERRDSGHRERRDRSHRDSVLAGAPRALHVGKTPRCRPRHVRRRGPARGFRQDRTGRVAAPTGDRPALCVWAIGPTPLPSRVGSTCSIRPTRGAPVAALRAGPGPEPVIAGRAIPAVPGSGPIPRAGACKWLRRDGAW